MATLLSLPPEIFNTIVAEVSGRDVTSIRRVCRRANALSSHQFGLKCLADLSFIWSSYSLQGLLNLSRHPLGRYVKRLTFATHFIYAERLTEDPVEQRTARSKSIFEQWEERNQMLVQALQNLHAAGVQPILGVYDISVPWVSLDGSSNSNGNDKQPRKGYGFEKHYGAVGSEALYPSFVHTIEYVLKAAQQASVPLKTFCVHWTDRTRHQNDEVRILRDQYLFSQTGESDSGLKFMASMTPHSTTTVHGPDLTKTITLDTQHRKLELYAVHVAGVSYPLHHLERSWDYPIATAILPRNNLDDYFCEIRLSTLDATVKTLTKFLKSQARSLRVLHLEKIGMPLYDELGDPENAGPDETALNFLSVLKNDLSLEYLRMTKLSEEVDRARLIGGHDDTWVGRHEIQDGLQMYMQREEDDEYSVDEDVSDEDEGEWVSVHHSEDEDDGQAHDGDHEATTQQSPAGEGEDI